jgi:hypothetical protein
MTIATQPHTTTVWDRTAPSLLAYACQTRFEPAGLTVYEHERPVAFVQVPHWDLEGEAPAQTGWPSVVAKEGSD